jgi:hypothetical protein
MRVLILLNEQVNVTACGHTYENCGCDLYAPQRQAIADALNSLYPKEGFTPDHVDFWFKSTPEKEEELDRAVVLLAHELALREKHQP